MRPFLFIVAYIIALSWWLFDVQGAFAADCDNPNRLPLIERWTFTESTDPRVLGYMEIDLPACPNKRGIWRKWVRAYGAGGLTSVWIPSEPYCRKIICGEE